MTADDQVRELSAYLYERDARDGSAYDGIGDPYTGAATWLWRLGIDKAALVAKEKEQA